MSIPPLSSFKPLNGFICIELVQHNDPASVWRIVSIADNCNLQHYPMLKPRDLVYTGAHLYKMELGAIAYIHPKEIKAIHPAP